MTTRKKATSSKLPQWLMLLLVFVTIQLWTSELLYVDIRPLPSHPLVIHQDPVSPSWAALEDVQESEVPGEKVFTLPTQEGVQLTAGQEAVHPEKWLEKVLPKSDQQPLPSKYKSLNGMIISQVSQIDPTTVAQQRLPASKFEAIQPQVTVTAQRLKPMVIGPQGSIDIAATVPAEETSFEQRARQLVQQEIERREVENKGPKVRKVPIAGGGHIIVASAEPQKGSAAASAPPQPSGHQAAAPKAPPSAIASPTVSLIEQSVDDRERPYLLSGNFSIAGGLAYVVGAMRFELHHVQYGVAVAEGVLWENQAKFEITVKELKGTLVLQLVDMDGNVLGKSELRLQSLSLPPENQQQIAEINLKLKPIPVGATAEVISAYSMGNQANMPVAKAEVEIDGLNRFYKSNADGAVDDPDVLPGSSFILRAKHKSYWGSLAVGLSGQRRTLQLFPEKMVEALLGLVAKNDQEHEELRKKGIVWGRIVQDGEPVAGAIVELAGEADASPIYLNDIYLPDKNMEGTGRNGLFAFVGVSSGIQSVRAIVNGAFYPAKVIPVEGHHVSHLELEVGQSTVATIKVTSAPLRNQAHSATFRIMGTDVEYRIDGEAGIQWPKGSGLMLLEADGGEGMDVIRMSLERGANEIAVPMIPSKWLQQLAIEKRINLEGQKGVVVGFVNNKNFQVFLDEKQPYGHENIIYFDKNGEIVRQDHGPAGGGFVLFNIPKGFRSINIVANGSDRILSRAVIAESAVTNVIPEVSL